MYTKQYFHIKFIKSITKQIIHIYLVVAIKLRTLDINKAKILSS